MKPVLLLLFTIALPTVSSAAPHPSRTLQRDETRSLQYEQKAADARDASIEMLRGFLADNPDVSKKPELMFRLADLLSQRSKAQLFIWREACLDKVCDPADATWQEPLEKALRLFELIVHNYPRYPRIDEAAWQQGLALQELGRASEGVAALQHLVKLRPDSARAGDAWLLIGEHYFEHDDANRALTAYKRAAANDHTVQRDHATYMVGWCQYNLGRMDDAIAAMRGLAFRHAEKGGDDAMLDASLRDLIRFYADDGRADEALADIEQLGRPDLIRPMLARTADALDERGQYEGSTHTRRVLISRDPNAPDNPEHQAKIVQVARQQGRTDDVLRELERLRTQYGPRSSWTRANTTNPDVTAAAAKSIELQMRQSAIQWHQEARKLGGASGKQRAHAAQRAYQAWLEDHTDADDAYPMHYAYAELLYSLKSYRQAYEHYTRVVQIDPKGEHSRFSAEAAIHAAEALIGAEPTQRVTSGLNENERRLVDACATYGEHYQDAKLQSVTYKAAYLLYEREMLDDAVALFDKTIEQNPGTTIAQQAAHLSLDVLAQREDYVALSALAKRYSQDQRLGDAPFRADIARIHRRAALQAITLVSGDAQRAQAYERWARTFGPSADADAHALAWHNAAVHYHLAGDAIGARRARLDLVQTERLQGSPHVFTHLLNLGDVDERTADFDGAVRWYRRAVQHAEHGTKHKHDPRLADALFSSAVLLRAMGRTEEAIASYNQYIDASEMTDDARVPHALAAVAELRELQRRYSYAQAAWSKMAAAPPTSPAQRAYASLRQGKAMRLAGQDPTSHYAALLDRLKDTDVPDIIEVSAEVLYLMHPTVQRRFGDLRITSLGQGTTRRREDAHQRDELMRITAALKTQKVVTDEIIATRSGRWSLAAIVQLAQAHERVASLLTQAQLPWYLTPAQGQMYRAGMIDQAARHNDAAVSLYTTALDKAYEITAYNDDTAIAFARRGHLAPDDYPGVYEELHEPTYASRPTHDTTREE